LTDREKKGLFAGVWKKRDRFEGKKESQKNMKLRIHRQRQGINFTKREKKG